MKRALASAEPESFSARPTQAATVVCAERGCTAESSSRGAVSRLDECAREDLLFAV
jgi:hypothetical protein